MVKVLVLRITSDRCRKSFIQSGQTRLIQIQLLCVMLASQKVYLKMNSTRHRNLGQGAAVRAAAREMWQHTLFKSLSNFIKCSQRFLLLHSLTPCPRLHSVVIVTMWTFDFHETILSLSCAN